MSRKLTFLISLVSAFRCAQRESPHELLLEGDVDQDGRDGGQQGTRGDNVVVREEGALEIVEGADYRTLVTRLHQDEGPEEVVVHEREEEGRHGRQRWPAERKDHAPPDPQDVRAVDQGGL